MQIGRPPGQLAHAAVIAPADLLAFFDRPDTGPTEALNGQFEHLRSSALGSRPLTNCVVLSLLGSGRFRRHLHPQMQRAVKSGRVRVQFSIRSPEFCNHRIIVASVEFP
jgi:hypothetical protein